MLSQGIGAAMLLAASAQQVPATLPAQSDAPSAQPAAPSVQPDAGAEVELMVMKEITGDGAKPGDPVRLQVNKAVAVAGGVIPAGTPAFGEVVGSSSSGMVMKRGTISIRLARLVIDGRDVPIEGQVDSRGRGGKSDDVVKVLVVPIYAILFARGNAGKFKAGQLIYGHLPADFRLPAADATAPGAVQSAS